MISKQGRTLGGVGLSQGNTKVTAGVFKSATTFHCHADGSIDVTWLDDTIQNIPFVAGEAFPIACKSIKVSAGTFSIGYD